MHPASSRRAALRLLATAPLAAGLAACGFHRSGTQVLSYQRVFLSGFSDRSTMAEEIRRALPEGSVVVPSVLDAQIVIEALIDQRNTTVEASTAFGQVREMQLYVQLRYRVLLPDGSELLPPADLERYRDLTYDEKDALAKDTELNVLYRDMQSDIATQLVRVLAAVGSPTGRAARAGAARAASGALPSAPPASEATGIRTN